VRKKKAEEIKGEKNNGLKSPCPMDGSLASWGHGGAGMAEREKGKRFGKTEKEI